MQATPEGDRAAALVKDLISNLPIDRNRVYVTGGSLGGGGSWHQIVEHQEIYAATVILCNGGKVTDVPKIIEFPIRQFHGDQDSDAPVQQARNMAASMNAADATRYRYTELTGEGHIIHPLVYRDAEVLTWLFAQRKAN